MGSLMAQATTVERVVPQSAGARRTTADSHRLSEDSNQWKPLMVVAAPLMLAAVEVFHPHPHDLFDVDIARWMAVHYAQIVLFPLAAWSQVMLVEQHRGYAATICEIAMCIFAVAYVAFDTSAGLVTGLLVRAAHLTNAPELWRAPVLAVRTDPVVGGSSGGAPALAVIGTLAWLVGTLCSAVVVRRARHSWLPVALLVVSALGLLVFRTHAWPGGPVTFGSLAAAVALVAW